MQSTAAAGTLGYHTLLEVLNGTATNGTNNTSTAAALPKDYTLNILAEVFSLAVYSVFYLLVCFIYFYRKIYQVNYLWAFAGDWQYSSEEGALQKLGRLFTGRREAWMKKKAQIVKKLTFYVLLQYFQVWLTARILTNIWTLIANAMTIISPSSQSPFNIAYSVSWMVFYMYVLLTMLLILSWLKVSLALYSVWNPLIGKVVTALVWVVLAFSFLVSTVNGFTMFVQEMVYLGNPALAKLNRGFVINKLCVPIYVAIQLLLTVLIVLLGITITVMIVVTNKTSAKDNHGMVLKDVMNKEKSNMEQLFLKILIAVFMFVFSLVVRAVGMLFLTLDAPFWARGFLTRALPEMFSMAGMVYVFWPLNILCCTQKAKSKAAKVLFAPVDLGDEGTDSEISMTPRQTKELPDIAALKGETLPSHPSSQETSVNPTPSSPTVTEIVIPETIIVNSDVSEQQ